MAAEVVGRQGLLEPGDAVVGEHGRAQQRLVEGEGLVGVDHEAEVVAHGGADGRQAAGVLGQMRAADLDLGTGEAARLHRERVLDQRRGLDVEPPALGRVDRHRGLRAPGHAPQRQRRAAAAQVPERGIHGGEREGGDRAHGGRVGAEEEVAPDALDLLRLAAEEARHQRLAQKAHHRGAAGADGVGVAGARRPVGVRDRDERRLLAHEALDRVGPDDLRRQVHHAKLHAGDAGHQSLRRVRPVARSKRCARSRARRKDSRSPGWTRREP